MSQSSISPSAFSIDQNDPTASLLRSGIAMLGTFFATKGYLDQSTATALAGAVATIAMALWGMYAKRRNAIIASAATRPGVLHVLVDSKVTADAITSNKVQAAGPLTPQVEALMVKVAAQ